MSEQSLPTKRRGRPPKNPEDKIIQDVKAYNKEYYAKQKENEEYKERIKTLYSTEEYKIMNRKRVSEHIKRLRELHVLVKKMNDANILSVLPDEYKNQLNKLLQPSS